MKAFETQGVANRRRNDDERHAHRLPRRAQHGPIGFGHVYSMVRKGRRQSVAGGTQPQAQQHHGHAPADADVLLAGLPTALLAQPALTVAADPNAFAHAAAGLDVAGANAGQQADATRMTPQRALQLVADQAADMDQVQDARELTIRLEPAHLGPLLVRIRVENGRVRAELVTREPDAARLLGSGREQLREKLAALGYAHAEVAIAHDADEFPPIEGHGAA